MTKNDFKDNNCIDCGKTISFSEFLNDNPSISEERAKGLWKDSMISIFCPNCYFNRPEKPFKVKRSHFNYVYRFRKYQR
ncbi:MAG: hypothetical protein ACFFDF_19335 [Candidatus Odinarchaeota archaeon]